MGTTVTVQRQALANCVLASAGSVADAQAQAAPGARVQRASIDWADALRVLAASKDGAAPAEADARAGSAVDRLVAFCQFVLQDAGRRPEAPRVLSLTVAARRARLLVEADAASVDAIETVVRQLSQGPLREANFEITLVATTRAAAARFGLGKVGATRIDAIAIDETAAGRLQKGAVAAGGALQNMPPTARRPLDSFAVRDGERHLGFAQWAPLAADAILLAYTLPLQPSGPPRDAGVEPTRVRVQRLQAGDSALLLVPVDGAGGEDAKVTVVRLRFTGFAATEPAAAPAEAPRDGPGRSGGR